MSPSDQVKGFVNNLVAGAVWDGIKQLWGPLVLAAVLALWEKARHGSLDWIAIGGMFVLASFLAFLNFRKPKQPPVPNSQQWKPAWQKLRWANEERERLATEVDQLKQAASAKGEFEKLADEDAADMSTRLLLVGTSATFHPEGVNPYIDATFRIVNTSQFSLIAEKVEGNAFYRGYSGEKCYLSPTPIIGDLLNFAPIPRRNLRELTLRQFVPLAITDNIEANHGKLKLDFSEVRVYFHFSGGGGNTRFGWLGDVVEASLPNSDQPNRAEIQKLKAQYLQENTEKTNFQKELARTKNRTEELERQLSEATKPDTSLRARTIATCDELTDFLREHGPKPEIPHARGEADADYLFKAMAVLDPYKGKMGADFRLRFSQPVKRIRDEIRVQCGMSERPLDKAIEIAESQLCEPQFVEEIRDCLWRFASTMNR